MAGRGGRDRGGGSKPGGRGIFPRYSVSEDVERELRSHLEMRAEELEAEGWDPASARAEAARHFGDRERVARECRAVTTSHHRAVGRAKSMEAVWQDLKYAVRTLAKSPAFTFVATVTLALGIGANTAIFSVVNGVLLRPLPFDSPEQLAWAAELRQEGGTMSVAFANFRDWRAETRSFSAMTAYNGWSTTVLGGAEPAWVVNAVVTEDFWRVFPVNPVYGRLTNSEDHREGAPPVAIVSRAFARDVLGGENAVGKVVETRGVGFQIVGVLPDSFSWPTGVRFWSPLELIPQGESRTAHNWQVVGRLAEGVPVEQARLEVDQITRRIVEGSPEAGAFLAVGASVLPLMDRVVGGTRRTLFLLLGASAFVLLVACSNLASTLLARGTVRSREIAVRAALGAGRRRLVRQLLAESMVLAGLGATVGVGLAAMMLEVLQRLAAGVPRMETVGLDTSVLLFTVLLAGATSLVFGLFPALRLTGEQTATDLRSGSRGNAGFRGATWGALVSTEVALALILLVGSGLLVRSLVAVLSVDGGFDGDDVALTTVALSGSKYPGLDDHRVFWEGMLERARSIPGVTGAAVMSSPPLGGASNGQLSLDGDPDKLGQALYVVASPEAFDVLDVPLLEGRFFDDRDGPGAPHTVLVSESFAARYWPDGSALGKLVSGGGMDNYWDADTIAFGTVVGVVGDVLYRDLTGEQQPTVYWNYRQRPFRIQSGGVLLVESASGGPSLVGSGLQAAVRGADPDVVVQLRFLSTLVSDSVSDRRFVLLILGVFAALGLVLAAVGIYGVVSYSVARRSREMGIRLALGASPSSVRGLVLGGAMRPVALGLVVGILGGLALTRLLQGMLYEVGATDPVTFSVVVLLLLGTAWLASMLPAVRSTRVDPMLTMRAE